MDQSDWNNLQLLKLFRNESCHYLKNSFNYARTFDFKRLPFFLLHLHGRLRKRPELVSASAAPTAGVPSPGHSRGVSVAPV